MSERRSFAEILKENLNSKSFKPPPKSLIQKIEQKIMDQQTTSPLKLTDPYQKEIYNYFIGIKELSKIHSSRTFYAKLFKIPVKISFYWCEEDWQGSIFAVYEYSGKFISVKGGFGSCEVCDGLPDSQEKLNKIFSHLMFNENINDINIHGNHPEYTHPELVSKFNTWKGNYITLRQIEVDIEIKETIKETVKKTVKETVKEPIKEMKKTWADIVSKKK
jgi:hypothetical protein